MVSRSTAVFILRDLNGNIKTVAYGLGIQCAKGNAPLANQLTASLQVQSIHISLDLYMLRDGRDSLSMYHVR